MSMDEVNERFPLTKYKMWRSSREHEGLPAAGGIAQPGLGSRPASVKDRPLESAAAAADAAQPMPVSSSSPATDKPDEQTRSVIADTHTHDQELKKPDGAEDTDGSAAAAATASEKPTDKAQEEKSGNGANPEAQSRPDDHHETDDEDDEDDPARAPVQQELLDVPGDTCAICLDNLDDDDDVRGLTCGHAFHAGCLDPWLTSRRACCPLCKADYYVPKVRPENAAVNPDEAQMSPLAQTGSRIGIPVTPRGAMIGRVGGGLPFLAFRPRTNNAYPGTPVSQQGVATYDDAAAAAAAEANQQRRGLGQSIFGFAGRLRRSRNTQAGSNPSTFSPTHTPLAQTNSQPLSTPPVTPRSPFVSSTTPAMTMNTTPSSSSPNWRTRLLPTTTRSSRQSRPSTDATPPPPSSSSFVSRLRRGRRDNGNNNNYHSSDDVNDDNNISPVGNVGNGNDSNGIRAESSTSASTSTPPVLPAPVFGGDVSMVTPSQLEAGVTVRQAA